MSQMLAKKVSSDGDCDSGDSSRVIATFSSSLFFSSLSSGLSSEGRQN